jgi:8-oxo-dGTP pyrophosphatase MutT (NUDIX family)
MRDRITVRVLLLDPGGRILLMKGRMPGNTGPGAWFTVGGGAEPGETVEACALREIAEETGFTEVELGPIVWRREAVGTVITGETMLFKESYMVARCLAADPVRDGWEDYEHELVDDMRWWTLEDLSLCEDVIYPPRFLELLPDIILGRYPDEPLEITVVEIR